MLLETPKTCVSTPLPLVIGISPAPINSTSFEDEPLFPTIHPYSSLFLPIPPYQPWRHHGFQTNQ